MQTKAKKIPFKEFKKIYSRVPRLTVEVVLLKGKSLLLIRRSIAPDAGKWHTPGGTVLKGEDLHQAVQRVAQEELAINVNVVKFLGIIEYKSFINHYSQDISLAYLVKPKSGKMGNLKIDLDGHADKYEFFSKIPDNTILDQKRFYSKHLHI